MARFLMLWRANPAALPLMPRDPSESVKMHEQWFATIEDLIKKGVFEEFGFFPDSREGCWAGYSIVKGKQQISREPYGCIHPSPSSRYMR